MTTSTVKQLVADLERVEAHEFPADKIHPSPHNPRLHFDKEKLASLATNIKAVGVLQAILLRPHPTKPGEGELVFGERRWRASKLAGLATVPARVRELTTLEVLELQAYENGQRDDVHPLEEADHFMRMHKPPKGADWPAQSIEEIMTKSGKSRSAVFAALKLCELGEVGRKLFLDGKFSKSVAYLVAQIYPPKVQDEAARELGRGGDENMSFRDAFDYVKQHYTLALEGCGFDTADAKLVEKAGACTTCPKRSGSQLELLGDAKKPDVCMDRVCFKSKQDAAWEIKKKVEQEKGATVVDDKKAKELFPHGSNLSYNAPYVDLDDECYQDSKNRKYKSLIPKNAPVVVARDSRGHVHRLVEKEKLPALMKAAGVKIESRSTTPSSVQDKARKAALEKRRRVAQRVIAEVAEKIPGGDPFYRLLLDTMSRHGYHDAIGEVVKRRGWEQKGKRPDSIFHAKVKELTGDALPRLAMELAIARDAFGYYQTTLSEPLTKAAGLAGVNVKKIEKAVAAEIAEKKAAKKKRTKATATKKAA